MQIAWFDRWNLSRLHGGPSLAFQAGIALVFGLAATGMLLGMFLAEKPVIFSLIGTLMFAVFFMLSGNQRLFCLWGLVLTAPFSLSKAFWIVPHMGGASAIMLDLCDPFLFGLLFFILRDYAKGWRRSLRWSPLLYFWGGLMLIGVMDTILGPYRQLAILEVIRSAKCYLLFFVIINEVVRARQIMHVFYALMTGVVIQCAAGLTQFILRTDLGLQKLGEPPLEVVESTTKTVYMGQGDYFRVGAIMEHPNILACYLAILLPIAIATIFSGISGLAKIVLSVIVMAGLVVLLITLSRGGWMSFGAAFLVLGAVSFLHERMRLRYVLARVAVLLACVVGLAAASGEIIKRVTESDPGAVKFRYEMMDVAWQMVEDRPVFGMGTNSFVAALPRYGAYGGPHGVTRAFGSVWPVVHNSYLIYWSEQGTVGLVLLLGVYGSLLWMGARSSRTMIDDRIFAINLGACCGIVASMVDGISSFFIAESQSERVFFLVAGLIVSIHYWTLANKPVRRPAATALQVRQPMPVTAGAA